MSSEKISDDRLRREVLPVIDRLKAGTERLLTPQEVRKSLRDEYRKLLKS